MQNFRSHEQQHYFNTPFQLSLPPSNMATEVLSDAPEAADRYEFSVEDGDVILMATDGVFDNVPDSVLVKEVGNLQNGSCAPDAAEIQVCWLDFHPPPPIFFLCAACLKSVCILLKLRSRVRKRRDIK